MYNNCTQNNDNKYFIIKKNLIKLFLQTITLPTSASLIFLQTRSGNAIFRSKTLLVLAIGGLCLELCNLISIQFLCPSKFDVSFPAHLNTFFPTFTDQTSFKLGNRSNHLEHQCTHRLIIASKRRYSL